jgi:endonuclease YncB( thermonuclease family)
MRNAAFFGLVAIVAAGFAITHSGDRRWHGKALDGDTFVRAKLHYRLASIDAPELPGHCRPGRRCVSGDPWRSRRALQLELDRGIFCRAQGQDYYKRTLVRCTTLEHTDLGALLINEGMAEPYSRGED